MALRDDQLESIKQGANESPTIRPSYYRADVPAVLIKRGMTEKKEVVRIECFDVIDALGLDFYTGNALKYLWRLGRKDGATKVEDLKKVRTYIDQALERAEQETG